MPDYSTLYRLLFNAITDALTKIDAYEIGTAVQILVEAQQKTEELYISADAPEEIKNTTDFGCIF